MAWTARGRIIEHCSCNTICPCYSSGLARAGDFERCVGFMAFEVESGNADGVDIGGHAAVFVLDAPGNMTEGNWKAGLIIDDGADDKQTEKLSGIFSGALGGPLAAFGPLIGENLGVERAPIRIHHQGDMHTITAGKLVDSEFKDERQEGADGPVQLLNTTALPVEGPVTISPPTRSSIRAFGWNIDNSGRHGTTSRFAWSA